MENSGRQRTLEKCMERNKWEGMAKPARQLPLAAAVSSLSHRSKRSQAAAQPCTETKSQQQP